MNMAEKFFILADSNLLIQDLVARLDHLVWKFSCIERNFLFNISFPLYGSLMQNKANYQMTGNSNYGTMCFFPITARIPCGIVLNYLNYNFGVFSQLEQCTVYKTITIQTGQN